MKEFNLPTDNVFEDQMEKYSKSALSKRLEKKYKPKPFEEVYKPLRTASWVTSYFCNVFSILTASTFVFTFIYSVIKNSVDYPIQIGMVLTGCLLVLIEFAQRSMVPLFFKTQLQFGWDKMKKQLIGLGILISCISIFGLALSYNGGFDVVSVVGSEPVKENPELYDIDQIKKDHKLLIAESSAAAESYKKVKLWNGRLSNENAKHYRNLLGKTSDLRESLNDKVEHYEQLNRDMVLGSKMDFENQKSAYEATITSKGSGLARFTILAQLVFFLSIWFMELFDYKTHSQYAKNPKSNQSKVVPNFQNIQTSVVAEKALSDLPLNQNKIGFKTGVSQTVKKPVSKQRNLLSKRGKTGQTQTVQTGASQTVQTVKPLQTSKGITATIPTSKPEIKILEKVVRITDKNTVPHTCERTGATTYKTLGDVNTNINTYQKRCKDSVKIISKLKKEVSNGVDGSKKRHDRAMVTFDNRKRKLEYWKGKKSELLNQSN